MTDPIRSALKRLLSAVLDGLGQDDHPMGWARVDDAIDAARAALAQPEPEAVGPSDEELLRMAAEAIDPYDTIGIGEYEAETECAVEVYGSELIAFARAVLSRWGRREPASVVGEPSDELVAQWIAEVWHEGTPVRVAASDLHLASRAAEWGARYGHQPAPPAEGEVE